MFREARSEIPLTFLFKLNFKLLHVRRFQYKMILTVPFIIIGPAYNLIKTTNITSEITLLSIPSFFFSGITVYPSLVRWTYLSHFSYVFLCILIFLYISLFPTSNLSSHRKCQCLFTIMKEKYIN